MIKYFYLTHIWDPKGTITLGPGSNRKKGVLRIPQGSSITGSSPSDCLI